MFRNIIRRIKDEKGQAVVELAITLPILLLILGGIVDFGWLITNQNAIDRSARDGARYAIVNAAETDPMESIKTYTKALAPAGIQEKLTVDVTFTTPDTPRSGDVIVEVSGNIAVLTPLAGIFTEGQEVNLSSSCRMKVE
ncbi:MAG: TadE/TadG family type IV pilus assembly protein [Desulfitobacteriaceae bacterium]|nr:TadE/TadG family type IV pilus assembly protein [Clostridia bacterium]MDD4400751.1 TadE/TadG family type IV pilus assembly protein [Desulfitobacteriaceae bacterium]